LVVVTAIQRRVFSIVKSCQWEEMPITKWGRLYRADLRTVFALADESVGLRMIKIRKRQRMKKLSAQMDVLQSADVIVLSEVDWGMKRTDYRP